MSKITFRADDDLVERLEALDASKSEVMREALRSHLETDTARDDRSVERERGAIDDLVRERVDDHLTERLQELGLESRSERSRERERLPSDRSDTSRPQDVSVTVSIEDGRAAATDERSVSRTRAGETGRERTTSDHEHPRERGREDRPRERDRTRPQEHQPETNHQCEQCGEQLEGDHVYCPNCGEKTSRRLFCECGDEVRSDWSFCPGCGRRTPAADVLESR